MKEAGYWYDITCPSCALVATDKQFDMSLSDECFCPKCGCDFILELEDDDDE